MSALNSCWARQRILTCIKPSSRGCLLTLNRCIALAMESMLSTPVTGRPLPSCQGVIMLFILCFQTAI